MHLFRSPQTRGIGRLCLPAIFLTLLASGGIFAQTGGWTQFGGPHRNFKADVKGLSPSWPESGPRQLWKRDLGEGYSPIASDGDTLYTMYRKGGQEVVVALAAASGKTLWEYAYKAIVTHDMTRALGPRATPLLVGKLLFTVGAVGNFHCFDRQTGKVLWSHDLIGEFKAALPDECYASSPLAYKNTVIIPAGAPGGSVMAFNQKDGGVVWMKQDFIISAASPMLIRVGGQDQLVVVMQESIVGLDPGTGDLLWSHPHKNRTKTNVSSPVWGEDNLLFCSSAYDSGGRMLRLTREGAKTSVEELWFQRLLRVHFTNVIRIGDTLYGSSGDFGPAPFTAVDAKTGTLLWQDRGIGRASFIYADGRFILMDEDGNLALASPTREGLKVHSKVQFLTNTAWTPPTLAGTRLYIRDLKTIMALELK
jgi:outer membrane protein assembly factor BamB